MEVEVGDDLFLLRMRFFSWLSHENIMPDVLGKHRANEAYERCSIILLLIFVQFADDSTVCCWLMSSILISRLQQSYDY